MKIVLLYFDYLKTYELKIKVEFDHLKLEQRPIAGVKREMEVNWHRSKLNTGLKVQGQWEASVWVAHSAPHWGGGDWWVGGALPWLDSCWL